MPRVPVNDNDGVVRGFVEDTADGTEIGLDLNYWQRGYYDPARNMTLDSTGKPIAHGNLLAELILGDFDPI